MNLQQQYELALTQIGSTLEKAKELTEIALEITVKNHEDQEGLAKAEALYKKLVTFRTRTEKARKSAQEPAQAAIKEMNAHVKTLLATLSPGEKHLAEQVSIVKDYEKRQKEAQEKEEQKRLELRIKELEQYEASIPLFLLAPMGEEQYQKELEGAKAAYEKKQAEAKWESEQRARLATENAALRDQLRESKKEELMGDVRKRFPTLELAWQRIYELENEEF